MESHRDVEDEMVEPQLPQSCLEVLAAFFWDEPTAAELAEARRASEYEERDRNRKRKKVAHEQAA